MSGQPYGGDPTVESLGSSDSTPNAFYEELVDTLNGEPITETTDISSTADISREEVIETPPYTLRRLWLPESGDVFDSSSILGLVIKYKQLTEVPANMGLSLLRPRQIDVLTRRKKGPQLTEEALETIANTLPSQLRVSTDRVIIAGPQGPLPGKRYIGFGLDARSSQLVQKDHDKILRGLEASGLRKRHLGHVSLFATKDPVVAEELRHELEDAVTLPGKILLGKAKPIQARPRRSY